MPRKPRAKRDADTDAGAAADMVIDLRRHSGIELVWDAVVVEDDPVMQKMVSATLEAAGLQVIGVLDRAEDAFPLLLASHPDLVILDDALAGTLKGSDVAARLKLSLPSVRIVLCSASPPEEVPVGVDAVAEAKTPKALMDAVRRVLDL